MIKSRNETSHTYNEATVNEIIGKIVTLYSTLFMDFNQKMGSLRISSQQGLFDSEL